MHLEIAAGGERHNKPEAQTTTGFRIATELSGQGVWRLSKVPLKTAETASGSCAFPELSIMLEHRIDTERLPRTLKEVVSQWPWRSPNAQDCAAFHSELRHAHSVFFVTGDLAQSHSTVSRDAKEEKQSIARAASPARRSRHSAVAPAGPEEREPGRKLAGGRRSGRGGVPVVPRARTDSGPIAAERGNLKTMMESDTPRLSRSSLARLQRRTRRRPARPFSITQPRWTRR